MLRAGSSLLGLLSGFVPSATLACTCLPAYVGTPYGSEGPIPTRSALVVDVEIDVESGVLEIRSSEDDIVPHERVDVVTERGASAILRPLAALAPETTYRVFDSRRGLVATVETDGGRRPARGAVPPIVVSTETFNLAYPSALPESSCGAEVDRGARAQIVVAPGTVAVVAARRASDDATTLTSATYIANDVRNLDDDPRTATVEFANGRPCAVGWPRAGRDEFEAWLSFVAIGEDGSVSDWTPPVHVEVPAVVTVQEESLPPGAGDAAGGCSGLTVSCSARVPTLAVLPLFGLLRRRQRSER